MARRVVAAVGAGARPWPRPSYAGRPSPPEHPLEVRGACATALRWRTSLRTQTAAVERELPRRARRGWRLLVGRPDAPALERHAVAVALAVLATAAGILLEQHAAFRVLLYVGAVAVAALRGGAVPGLWALVICAAGFVLVGGGSGGWLVEPDPAHRLLFFVASGALAVWAASALREGYRQTYARRRRAEARADSQRVAMELGVRALAEPNLDALLTDTLVAIREALRCDVVTLLELQPGGDSVQLRDAVGWARSLVGSRYGPDEAPLAFRALEAREPIMVDDLRREPELASPALLEHGVVSSLVAPVVAAGPGGRSSGVIGVHTTTRRSFGADDAAFLQTAANVVGTAVVRLRADEAARRAVASERFLAEASRQLALSIEWQQTLSRVARLALPFLGDWCLVVVVGRDGRPRNAVAEASDPQRTAAVQDLLERYPVDLQAAHGVGRVLRTGEPELIAEVSAEEFVRETNAEASVRLELLRRLGFVSYVGAPLRAGGRVLGAIGFGIAEGRRRFGPEDLEMARELAQRCAVALDNASLYRAAQDATRAREQVLAVVSHDLKAPLGALLMGAQLVDRLAARAGGGDDLRRAATGVHRAAERMRRLINDLVDMDSIEAGGLSISATPTDPAAIAREAADAAQDLSIEGGIALRVDLSTTPAVECDRDRILQVLSNLLANALHVTPKGGAVDLAVRGTDEEVVFTVADTGPGIREEDLPHVFDRWYRGRAVRYPGSGLGLAISRSIVTAHGGSIWVRSKEGEGATFSFALPRSFRQRGDGVD